MNPTTHISKRRKPDLLGCICLDADCEDPEAEDGCRRNCRRDDEEWDRPEDGQLVAVPSHPPLMDEPSNTAYERVLLEENQRPDQEVVALAAWSNGKMEIWFA